MRLVAIRSAGLAGGELKRAAEAAGLQLAVVTTLDEAVARGMRRGVVVVDGLGETTSLLQALRRHSDRIEHLIWLGFEAPGLEGDNITVVSPLDDPGEIVDVLAERSGQELDFEFDLDDPPAVEDAPVEEELALPDPEPVEMVPVTHAPTWDESVQPAPPKPVSIAPQQAPLEKVQVRFADEPKEDQTIDAEIVIRRRRDWHLWKRPVIGVTVLTIAGLLAIKFAFPQGARVALPASASTMPIYPAARGDKLPDPDQVRVVEKKLEPKKEAKPAEAITASQPTPPEKKAAGSVVAFDEGPLQGCTARLGKKGKARLKRYKKLSLRVRLGVMGNGHIAAASVLGVRIGKKRYRSKRFNACAEGAIVGQQLELRPEREPTFIKRTFTLRP